MRESLCNKLKCRTVTETKINTKVYHLHLQKRAKTTWPHNVFLKLCVVGVRERERERERDRQREGEREREKEGERYLYLFSFQPLMIVLTGSALT